MTETNTSTQNQMHQCNVCGGGETDHHLCVATERVFGATVWVYDDGFARVVPNMTRNLMEANA